MDRSSLGKLNITANTITNIQHRERSIKAMQMAISFLISPWARSLMRKAARFRLNPKALLTEQDMPRLLQISMAITGA